MLMNPWIIVAIVIVMFIFYRITKPVDTVVAPVVPETKSATPPASDEFRTYINKYW
jgi:hypothetical protein